MAFSTPSKHVHACSKPTTIRVLALSLYGPQAASHRVRFSQYQDSLRLRDIHLDIQSLLDDNYVRRIYYGRPPSLISLCFAYIRRLWALRLVSQYDLVIVYGELFKLFPFCLESLLLRVPYVYDLDDAFYLKYQQGRLRFLKPFLGSKFAYIMGSAVAITAGSRELEVHSRIFNNNVISLPSAVDTDYYRPLPIPKSNPLPIITIGWIGSPSTSVFLHELVEPLIQLAHTIQVRFIVVGGSSPNIPGVDVVEYPWTLHDELSLIQQFDIGVMPLPDTPWTRGKCAYKLIQYMACGIPVVASPVGANLDAVPPTCGFFASGSDEWLSSFRKLATDPHLRNKMGREARQWVVEKYSIHRVLPILETVIRDHCSS